MTDITNNKQLTPYEDIRTLKLHQGLPVSRGIYVLRVAGGLIYQYSREWDSYITNGIHTQFVPFTDFIEPNI